MELLKNLEGMSADEQMTAVVELQKAAMKHLEEQKQASIGKSAELVIQGLKKIKSDFEAKFDSLNYDIQTKVASLKDGEQGLQGPKGEQGERGLDGSNGRDGRDGKDGKDGLDGVDGVGVRDAKIDFDGSLVISLTDGREINCGEVVSVDVAKQIQKVTHNIQTGSGGDSQTVLDAIAALQATIATYGTMATQNKTSVDIEGGTIDNTTIGATTPSTGVFTTLTGGGGSANFFQTQGAATTKAVEVKALGSDTNIAFVIDSKGTGAIDLAAGSSGVNISNGGTVTAITRTAAGTFYTSIPTLTVSAPTTSGGVQATATPQMAGQTVTVQAAGTGYVVGNTLTVVGGTSSTAAQLRVDSIDGSGGVTATSFVNTAGAYSVLPTNPVSVTGGAGSGATFNITQWFFASVGPIITNAGSGYVEQPTVSFSGGGGSGAAAYARVGGNTTVKTLGTSIVFSVPEGTGFAVSGTNSSGGAYWQAFAGGGTAILRAIGTTSGQIQSNGAVPIQFSTNAGSSGAEQLRVSHTASAVNYVQVTGAATGNNVTISAQGSDSAIGVNFQSKSTSGFNFFSGAGSNRQLRIDGTITSVNYLDIWGGASGFAPSLRVAGSDTNIDLALTPKGTGALVAQASDGVTINARGANAVDWSTSRYQSNQVASGAISVIAGGYAHVASGSYSGILSGNQNIASSQYSAVVNGVLNNSGGFASFIGNGQSNSAAGYYNFIGNGFTNSGTSASAVTTQSGTMNATTAVTLSGSNANIKVGQYITGTSIASDTYVAAISGTSLTLSKNASGSSTSTLSFYTPHGVVVGGGNNTATGSYSFIGGGGDAGTAANRNVASGDYAAVVGGRTNIASGISSFVGGGGFDGSSSTYGNIASSSFSSVVGGAANAASGFGSFVGGGAFNGASAQYAATVCGSSNAANGTGSSVLSGYSGIARGIVGNSVFAASVNPINTTQGTSQSALLVLAVQTTDATATVLRSSSSAASTINQVILPNNSAYYFRGEVVSGKTGGGDTKGWYIEGVIKRGANAASTALVGTPTVTSNYADVGASTWTIAVTADTTNGGLAVTFTGQASTTIRTVARINTVEMTY